ncbi:LacI family DNA-binding transcriptional regulator [Radicibacter daui]|uniref:LacI family DNA-binding transcriptional regulator n=1 Tax=Radicibacter daui TaxID=3064829 RepID=UPI0040469F8F
MGEETTRSKVTLREIAELAGVSISTASRALSGAAGLSDPVRAKVQAAADRLNYVGAAGNSLTVTVLATMAVAAAGAPEFQMELFSGIQQACDELGITLSYSLMGEGQPVPLTDAEGDGARQGYVLLSFHDETLIGRLAQQGIPAVIVNGSDPLMRLDAISAGNRSGGYAAAGHLLGFGHRRILHLTHGRRLPVRDRLHGAGEAIQMAGLPFDPDLVVELADMRSDLAYEAVRERLARLGKTDFTAIQCCNDASAFGAMAALAEAGLRVPEDVSVIGFDDIPMAGLSSPALTTVRVLRREIGAFGLRRLLERMKAPEASVTLTEFAGPLVVRASTGPARS